MSDTQLKSIYDVLGVRLAHVAGDVGQHAGTEAIGKVLQVCGDITEDKRARDFALAIAFGIIAATAEKLARTDETFRILADATRDEYLKGFGEQGL